MTARRDQDEDVGTPIPRNQCRRISAVAELLDISISSVRRLIRGGQLRAVHIGVSVRVTETSLEALLKAGKQQTRRRRNQQTDRRDQHAERRDRDKKGETT